MIGEPPVVLLRALEPDPSTVNLYPGYLRRPRQWVDNTLYVFYEGDPAYRQVETDPSCLRLDFNLRAVYVIDPEDEEAQQERYLRIDEAIAAKLDAYTAILSARAGIPHNISIVGWSVDPNFFSDFNESGLALLITGYRLP